MALLTPVISARAQQLFDLLASQPQIPFQYPDDGCWARANEMCRILLLNQVTPGKAWIYGNLHVATKNSPACSVSWGWHVAPILSVTQADGTSANMVVDPSMFNQPATEATWKGAMHDPNAQLVETDASVFQRTVSGSIAYDPGYVLTQQTLRTYENELLVRVAEDGPPPYNCPNVP
jgi:hypothetical protein